MPLVSGRVLLSLSDVLYRLVRGRAGDDHVRQQPDSQVGEGEGDSQCGALRGSPGTLRLPPAHKVGRDTGHTVC